MLKVNLKLLALLAAGFAALGTGAHFLREYQVRRNAGALLDRVTRAEKEGGVERALHLLGRYILLEPTDADARVRYGELLEANFRSLRDRVVVMAVYEQALRHDPGRQDIRRRQVRLGLETGDLDTAWGHLQILERHVPFVQVPGIRHKEFPDDGELCLLKARYYESRKNHAEARDHFQAAIHRLADPVEAVEAHVRLARLLRGRFNDRDAADGVLSEMMRKYADLWQAGVERASYLLEFERSLLGAAPDLAKALRLAPREPRVLLLASQLAREQNKPAEARALLRRGLEAQPRSVPMYLALAQLELQSGEATPTDRLEKALTWLRLGLKELPQQTDLLAASADLLIQRGELKAARDALAQLRQSGAPAADLMFLDARACAREQEWSRAARILEDLRSQPNRAPELAAQADLLLGTCYQQLNDDRQLAVFRRAAGRDAEDPQAALGLAGALLYSGRIDEAAAEYERLMRLPRAPAGGWTLLARVLTLQNLETPAAQRDWARVNQVLDRAEKATPGDSLLVLLRAEVLAAEAGALAGQARAAKMSAARNLLNRAREKDPKQAEFAVALAGLAARAGDGQEAFRVLDQAARDAGDSVLLRLARVRHAPLAPGSKPHDVLAEAERGADRFPEAERVQLFRGLAEAHYALGSTADALRLGELAREKLPGELRIRLLLFDAALKGNDGDRMTRYLDEINAISREGPLWHYACARRLLWQARRDGDRAKLERAHHHLNEVARRRASWSRVPLCRAEAFELEGKLEEAIDCYQLALTLGDRQVAVIERLVKLLYDRGRYAQAEAALARLQALTPLSPDLQRVAAEAFLQKPDFDRARALAQQAVRKDSKNYKDQIWLARVLFITHQRQEAEEPLRRAVALAPTAAEPWVALVQYHVALGQPEKARAAIRQARAKLPPAEAPQTLAPCFEAVGDAREAEAQYRAAVAARPDSPAALRAAADFFLRAGRPADAVPHLRKLSAPTTKAPREEAAWGRRQLALALAGTGDYSQFQEALRLVGGETEGEKQPLEEHRARALVLGAHPAHRGGALNEFQSLARRAALTATEQFHLSRLLEADGQPAEARKALQEALALDPRNKAFLAHYALLLLRQGRRNDAAMAIDRLRGQGAWDFDAVALQARALAADAAEPSPPTLSPAEGEGGGRGPAGRGKAEEMTRLVAEYVGHKDASPKDEAARRALAARLLDELGQDYPAVRAAAAAAAESWYRRYIDMAEEKEPECRLRYAGFLGRQRRPAEALAQCEKALRRCPPGRVAAACIISLQAAQADKEHYERAERWLAPLAQKASPPPEVLEALACAREHQGRFDEAERLYRDLLARNGRNVVSLNNLAYLLALRGQGGEAVALAERAIAVLGPVAELLDTRAVALLAANRADEARRDVRRARAQKAMPPSVTFHLAQAERLAGDAAAAKAALAAAVKAGLKEEDLHPLERPAYAKLRLDLGVR